MKLTIQADTLEDARRAVLQIERHALQHPEPRPRPRDGVIYTAPDGWQCLVWGSPDHWRAECCCCSTTILRRDG